MSLHDEARRDMIAIMSDLASRLLSLSSRKRNCAVGEQLFRAGDPVEQIYLVLCGEIVLERISAGGGRLILQRARAHDIIAEASLFASRYHCDAIVTASSEVLSVPLPRIVDACRSAPDLMEAFARHFARQLQEARARAEILSLRKVSDRLDAWLSLHDGKIPEQGGRVFLAHEIGVTPEALYRELARRKLDS
jgi:CRP-like cAMP-binding protein